MTYIDSISMLKLHHGWGGNFLQRSKVKHSCNELIKNHENLINLIKKLIQEIEIQLDKWEHLQEENCKIDDNEDIKILRTLVSFLKVNGRLTLISLDISTAYKFIISSTSDYEYRFFARRIYTLLYETRNGLIKHVGKITPLLTDIIDQQSLTIYKREHSEFSKFLNQYNEELKYIRNTNEAHKGEEFEAQVYSIEQLSVVDSFNLIQEGSILLANMNSAFSLIMASLSTALHEISQRNISLLRDN